MPEAAGRVGMLAHRFGGILAFVLGSLTVLAFAPYGLWPIQLLTLCGLCALLREADRVGRSAVLGWMYGFGWQLFGTCWIYISLHDYGDLPAWMTVIAVAGLALFLSGLMAAAAATAQWCRQRWQLSHRQHLLLVWPALFMLAEWTRAWIFTGFPWLSAGYAHTAAPLGGFAALVGVYGIGLLCAIVAGALLLMRGDRRLIALPMVLLLAGALLRLVDWTTPHGAPITVRLLQPNVAQEVKFNPQRVPLTLQQYAQMITAAPADLIATPETALPILSSQLPADYLPWLDDFARRSHSQLLVGVPLSVVPGEASNSVIGLGAAGPYHYDKHHLVPFGEFTPRGFRWFLDMMQMPLGDFNRGALQQTPLAVKDQWVMPNICYEDLFGEEIAAQLDGGSARATILLNVSNIAWFGNSIALPQHLQISQMRALETGRPMLRATNTGATAVIDRKGRVMSALAPLTVGTLAATVQGYTGATPYIRVGNHLAVLLALLMLAAAWRWRGKKLPSGPPAHPKTR